MKSTINYQSWVIYEDNHLVIVNKPANIPVQSDISRDKSLIDYIKDYIKFKYDKPGNIFLGLPHRIDRPVSGIVILCKTSKSLSRVTKMFRENKIKKIYWAIVENKINKSSGTLINYLKKNKRKNKSHCINEEKKDYKRAELNFLFKKELENYFHYEIELITGRHHQIRSQLSYIGSCIKGDIKYGAKRTNKSGGINLHSREVEFIHPIKKKLIKLVANTPNEIIWRTCTN